MSGLTVAMKNFERTTDLGIESPRNRVISEHSSDAGVIEACPKRTHCDCFVGY